MADPDALPEHVAHYAWGAPFRSLLDLEPADRDAVVASAPHLARRYGDPTYVALRTRIEARMAADFRALGGRPARAHPHYALIGRSARIEAAGGRTVALLDRAALPADQVSFTWGDSFAFDPDFRAAVGLDHPAAARVYPWDQLAAVVARWPDPDRPAWQNLEVQLWFDPAPDTYRRLDL